MTPQNEVNVGGVVNVPVAVVGAANDAERLDGGRRATDVAFGLDAVTAVAAAVAAAADAATAAGDGAVAAGAAGIEFAAGASAEGEAAGGRNPALGASGWLVPNGNRDS